MQKPAKIDWFEFFSETMRELWNAKILNANSGTRPIDTSPLFHHKNEAFLSWCCFFGNAQAETEIFI
jgi:hypothetical protein